MGNERSDVVYATGIQSVGDEFACRGLGIVDRGQQSADCRVVDEIGQAIGTQEKAILREHVRLTYVHIQPGG